MNYFKKRRMKKQFQEEGLLPERKKRLVPSVKKVGSSIYKGQQAVYSFIDDVSAGRKKAKRKNPFGRIKDRSFFEGGFF